MKVLIDEDKCIGCGTCEAMCPECFKMNGNLAEVTKQTCDTCDVKGVAESCPVDAIIVQE